MISKGTEFSVRRFLKGRGALVVHFSTPMSRHEHLFPDDLRNAMNLENIPLSFSTILPCDAGPYGQPSMRAADANAGGSVGIVVDVCDVGSVVTVGPSDDGTYFDEASGTYVSGGSPPSQDACDVSFDKRTTANEWWVKNYIVVGIFVFCPIMVRARQDLAFTSGPIIAEQEIRFDQVLSDFPDQRVFTARYGQFFEFDRARQSWSQVQYEAILP